MQQLNLPRPLPATRVLGLPDRTRAERKAPITAPAAERTPLKLPLRPVESLPPRPIQRGLELPCGAIAFTDAAQAWLWTFRALAARHGALGGSTLAGAIGEARRRRIRIRRPCDPDDVILALDLLHRRGEITLSHARALRRWGERGRAPDTTRPEERADARLWSQALDRLEVLLRAKRIVAVQE